MTEQRNGVCSIEGCDKPVQSRGWCQMHYYRWYRTGSTELKERVRVVDRKEKVCSGCKQLLPIDAFFRDRSHQDGRTYHCKLCFTKPSRKYKYSLPTSVVDWLADRGSRCEICGTPLQETTVNIDHDRACCPKDRSCGKCVRGPLCRGCNLGLGNFLDSPTNLRSAAKYLERYASLSL